MGKFKEKQRVCITSGAYKGEYAEIIMHVGKSYFLRLDGSGKVITEHNLEHVKGSKDAEEAERKAEEEARAREARAAEKRLEEEAQDKALLAIKRAEERERARVLAEQQAAATSASDGAAASSGPDVVTSGGLRPEAETTVRRGPQAMRGASSTAEEEQLFERGDSSTPQTYPVQAGDVRKGSHLMIKGHPCRCTEVSSSKTGKHGHAKSHIVAVDVFTGKKYEDVFTSSHYIDVPYVKRMEYQVLNVDLESGEVSLLHESGITRDDLNLPTFVKTSEQTDDDRRLQRDIVEAFDMGKTIMVAVVSACGEEKIVDMKTL